MVKVKIVLALKYPSLQYNNYFTYISPRRTVHVKIN